MGDRGLTFWRRRYLLKHYQSFDDEALAAGAGIPKTRVTEFLGQMRAVRVPSELRRIAAGASAPPPPLFTPASARHAVTKLQSRPLHAADCSLIALIAVASLVLYAWTAARTVTGEDAGEFMAAAHTFGVPHPPGYPLWLLLAWAADHLLPLGTVALRITLVSVLPSAAANALLLAVTLKTLRSRIAAFTSAAIFAVSLTHWTQAVIPEVYGLNTLFVALQILLLVRLAERPAVGRLMALAAVSGLSCTNHTSAFPIGAVTGLAALLVAPDLFRSPRVVVGALLAGVLPMALFLILPLASAHGPYMDWGHPQTMDALWRHVTRAQYAEVHADEAIADSHPEYLRRLGIMASWGAKQFAAPWVTLLAVLGLLPLFVRQTGLWLYLVAVGWLCSVAIVMYTVFPFEREHIYAVQIFWIPAWLVVAWLAGGGLDAVFGLLTRLHGVPRRGAQAVACAGCLGLVVGPAITHYALADRSRTTAIESFGRSILDAMGPGALYFPSSDHSTFSVLYQQGVLNYRTDVVIADKTGEIEPAVIDEALTPGDREELQHLQRVARRAFLERTLIQRWRGPVYFANRRDMRDVPDRVLEPVGPVFQVMTPDESQAWWTEERDGSEPPGLLAWKPFQPLLEVDERQQLDFTVQMVRSDMLYMRGFAELRAHQVDAAQAFWNQMSGDLAPMKQLLNNVGAALAENHRPELAQPFLARALDEDPRYVMALRNLAFVQQALGHGAEAASCFRRMLDVDPEDRGTRLELAHQLSSAGDAAGALQQFEELASRDRKDPLPWREAGLLLLQVGDRVKAKTALTEALRLAPDDQVVAEAIGRVDAVNPIEEAQTTKAPAPFPRLPEVPGLPEGVGPSPSADPLLPKLPTDPSIGLSFDDVRSPGRAIHPGGSAPRPPRTPR